jgi:hypothetical protein
MRRAILSYALFVLVGILLFSGVPAHAEKTAMDNLETAELRDPEAIAELTRATSFLMETPQFHINVLVVYDVIQEDGRRLQFEKQGAIYVQRPNKLFADILLDNERQRTFWYDGESLSIAEKKQNIHTQIGAPKSIDATLDLLEQLHDDPMPLADLFYNDLTPLSLNAVEADIVDDSLVAGIKCTHLAFRGETVDWQIWVDQSDTPLIHKISVSYRNMPGVPQYTAWISNWSVPGNIPEGQFDFTVPEGSSFIKILAPGFGYAQQGGAK